MESCEIKRQIKEYHLWHGDTCIEVMGVVRDAEGFEAHLVRYIDALGIARSSIDTTFDYVTELESVERSDEAKLVQMWERGEL